MSRTLDLPDDLYERLALLAKSQGKTTIELLQSIVSTQFPAQIPQGATVGQLLQGRLGVASSGSGAPLSERTAEQFTDYLEQKHKARRS